MDSQTSFMRQIENPALSRSQQAQLRCELAREMEEAGNYEAAREAMGELWRRVGEAPIIEGLERTTAAEVLLRAGVLSGWIGSAQQVDGAQEIAKDLISRSAALFESLRQPEKVAEAQSEMAICYWREGSFDEARVVLQEALSRFGEGHDELKVKALLQSAQIERDAGRHHDALSILTDASLLLEDSSNQLLKGKFHGQLANLLERLGASEGGTDYRDRALVEYAAASFHFEQAGHTRYSARIENNLGSLLLTAGRFVESHEHLDRARRLFSRLKDEGGVAQVDETRARVFLAQGQAAEAEVAARAAVRALKRGDESRLLAEALTTHGTALARLSRHEQSRLVLEEAINVAERAGDDNNAGLAALVLIEEHGDWLQVGELREMYERADQLLAHSQQSEVLDRLRRAARRVLADASRHYPEAEPFTHDFVYGTEQSAKLLRDAHRIAGTMQPVLISGETGTGKSLLARLIHQWSGRSGKFVELNCAMLTETPIESQLFGHRKGSFKGANVDEPGAVRQAAGGTLFLDEVGELSMQEQTKLLRLVEYGEVHSIGASHPQRIDVRLITATSLPLHEKLAQKLFREDLYYRLQTFHLEILPLRERPEDIPVLAERFINEAFARYGKRISFSPEAINAMRQLPLRGNARELRSLIERTVLTAPHGAEITRQAVELQAMRQTPSDDLSDAWAGCRLDDEVRQFEGKLIRQALEASEGQITRAARLLGVTHQCLAYILQGRHKELLKVRTPVQRRRRSIIQKPQSKREGDEGSKQEA